MKRSLVLIPIALAGLAAQGQTPKPAFEVASIKPAIPLGPLGMRFDISGGPGTRDPGLYRCQNCSLYLIVTAAYDIKLPAKFSGPDWLQNVRFDISAKLPDGATKEAFHLMLQNLLAERFKLAVHREKKEMPVYELTVAKNGPKFKESVPKDAPQDDASPGKLKTDGEGYPVLAPGMTMAMLPGHARLRSENQTMEWFADMLSHQVGGPIIDATGLKGKYDFVLSWVLEERSAARGGMPDAASEPTGPTLLSAIQSQLGLKLDAKKGLVEVLVVDHIEKVPTEN
jgi:uncharacterized protein (TIGR03435 family)